MYQILQKFDIHWHDGGPSIAMMYHLRRVSDLLCNWKSCLLCYMKDVVLHCSIFFKWNKLVRVRVRVRVQWTLNLNLNIFIHKNAFANVVWEMAAILFMGRCVMSLAEPMLTNSQSRPLFTEQQNILSPDLEKTSKLRFRYIQWKQKVVNLITL